MTDSEKIEAARKAITYTLDRAQTDANLGYFIGPMTEAFRLLCEAEAALTGKTLETVTAARSPSLARYPREYLNPAEHREAREKRRLDAAAKP